MLGSALTSASATAASDQLAPPQSSAGTSRSGATATIGGTRHRIARSTAHTRAQRPPRNIRPRWSQPKIPADWKSSAVEDMGVRLRARTNGRLRPGQPRARRASNADIPAGPTPHGRRSATLSRMDPRLRPRIEIETIHELLPELDYYQLLGVAPACPQQDIDAAFRGESRRLHPDRHAAGATPEFRTQSNDVFKAVNDAYRTLRDPDARARYDAERRSGALRMDDAARKAAEADAAAKNDPTKAARTPKGEKYWKMALQCFNDADFNGAVMQINFALSFEPDNTTFREWLEKAKVENEGKKKGKTGNAYKIRF